MKPEDLKAEVEQYSAQINVLGNSVIKTDDDLREVLVGRLGYLLEVRSTSGSGMGADDAASLAEALVRDHVDLIYYMLKDGLEYQKKGWKKKRR